MPVQLKAALALFTSLAGVCHARRFGSGPTEQRVSNFLEEFRHRIGAESLKELWVAGTSKIRDLDTRMAERRSRGGAVRDLRPGSQREPSASKKPFLSPLGWLGALAVNIAVVALIGLGFVLLPPVLDCREQSARGFFAGDAFTACVGRGFSARSEELDGRLRRMILRSGQ
jgi:hypothetical protein